MDNECADFFTNTKDNPDYVKFMDAVKQGLLTEKDLDVSLTPFTARMRLGMFDPPENGALRANAGIGNRQRAAPRTRAEDCAGIYGSAEE